MRTAVLDIGGTSIKSGLFEDGRLFGVRERDTEAKLGGAHVMELAVEILGTYGDFDRIGVSTAGQVDSVKGCIRYANENIPGYTGMQVKRLMEERFGRPAAVENDVNAAALGEAYFGAGRDREDFLCLTYGTGVGGAIVIHRQIYTGSEFSAGEFGGIVVHGDRRTPENDIFSGCYERYASTTALVREAKKLDKSLDSGRAVFARIDEEAVREITDRWIREIVYGLTTLIHLFNPSCVILGGGIMSQTYIIERVRTLLRTHIMPSFQNVEIRQAALGNTAGMLGAAALANKDNGSER